MKGPSNEMQPRILKDEWVQELVKSIAIVNRQVAVTLKANIKKMDRRMGPLLPPQKWEVGEHVIYRLFKEKDHSLSLLWTGPVRIVNKTSVTVHQVEIQKNKQPIHEGMERPITGAISSSSLSFRDNSSKIQILLMIIEAAKLFSLDQMQQVAGMIVSRPVSTKTCAIDIIASTYILKVTGNVSLCCNIMTA